MISVERDIVKEIYSKLEKNQIDLDDYLFHYNWKDGD